MNTLYQNTVDEYRICADTLQNKEELNCLLAAVVQLFLLAITITEMWGREDSIQNSILTDYVTIFPHLVWKIAALDYCLCWFWLSVAVLDVLELQ